jgi:hypothetical protein
MLLTEIAETVCRVVVTSYTPWTPATCNREAEGELLFEVRHLDGTPAPELTASLDKWGRAQLERDLIAQCENREEDY